MKLYIENNKLYHKGLFGTKEIAASEIEKVEVEEQYTTVSLKNGKILKEKESFIFLYEQASYFVQQNVSYEDKTFEGKEYPAYELKEKMETVKQKAYQFTSKTVKERLGETYDVDFQIVGGWEYSLLIMRLTENGTVLSDHPLYGEIGEFGVDRALDEMDLTFLVKWDAFMGEGFYGVTEEVDNEELLKQYLEECLEEYLGE